MDLLEELNRMDYNNGCVISFASSLLALKKDMVTKVSCKVMQEVGKAFYTGNMIRLNDKVA